MFDHLATFHHELHSLEFTDDKLTLDLSGKCRLDIQQAARLDQHSFRRSILRKRGSGSEDKQHQDSSEHTIPDGYIS